MAKRWHKWVKKNKRMDHEHIENGEMKQLREKEQEKNEPAKFSVRKYKTRFVRVTGYKLPEDSKIHCADGTELAGVAGDYYVCLDDVHELVLAADIFKKLFLLNIEENQL